MNNKQIMLKSYHKHDILLSCLSSVKADGNVPDDILMDLLDKAYGIVLAGFSKKKQKEILGDGI